MGVRVGVDAHLGRGAGDGDEIAKELLQPVVIGLGGPVLDDERIIAPAMTCSLSGDESFGLDGRGEGAEVPRVCPKASETRERLCLDFGGTGLFTPSRR